MESNDLVKRILGGDGIFSPVSESAFSWCSAGFWARGQANINYIATAGHCFGGNDPSFYLSPQKDSSYLIGQMIYHLLDPIDFGLIYLNLTNVRPTASIRNRNSITYPELIINDLMAVSSIGAHLCHSGYITNVECGNLKSLNGDGFVRSVSKGLIFRDDILIVDAWSSPGDSGGPVYHYKDLRHVSLNGILTIGIIDQIETIGHFGALPLSSIINQINISVVTVGSLDI
ncbi:serine protease [Gigaspora margarita]|uniref:Serine protease n=1 Tax=Gigaspora margarita TaxID=4874 RepID=A0A8H4EVC7_GIGMA|nr:serine protease [Gigaspora margarita]